MRSNAWPNWSRSSKSKGDKWEAAMQIGFQAVLCSPKFLFRVELDHRPDSAEPHPIDDHQLASRLSYFLWSSMPDEELFVLAEKKQLHQNLENQVRRLLKDPALECSDRQLRHAMAAAAQPQDVRSRSQDFSRVGRAAAQRHAQGDRAVPAVDHAGGPQHPRPDRRRFHVHERTPGPALRHHGHHGQSLRQTPRSAGRQPAPGPGVQARARCKATNAAAS